MVHFLVYGDVIVGIAGVVTENPRLVEGIILVDLLSDGLPGIKLSSISATIRVNFFIGTAKVRISPATDFRADGSDIPGTARGSSPCCSGHVEWMMELQPERADDPVRVNAVVIRNREKPDEHLRPDTEDHDLRTKLVPEPEEEPVSSGGRQVIQREVSSTISGVFFFLGPLPADHPRFPYDRK
jgi:hypothetical protein